MNMVLGNETIGLAIIAILLLVIAFIFSHVCPGCGRFTRKRDSWIRKVPREKIYPGRIIARVYCTRPECRRHVGKDIRAGWVRNL
jgi:predicted Fe-S protein YdhL (DUF1289 family)